MENTNQSSSFWQFSDQLRVQSNNLSNLSLNDSIWSSSYVSKRPEKERRNFDIRVGGDVSNSNPTVRSSNSSVPSNSDFNGFNFDWKIGSSGVIGSSYQNPVTDFGINGGFNKGIYPKPSLNINQNYNQNYNQISNSKVLNAKSGGDEKQSFKSKQGKNKKNRGNNNVNNSEKDGSKKSVDKRFKTLPPSESLPKDETVGGYIFVCNNDTMPENLKRQLFGMFVI